MIGVFRFFADNRLFDSLESVYSVLHFGCSKLCRVRHFQVQKLRSQKFPSDALLGRRVRLCNQKRMLSVLVRCSYSCDFRVILTFVRVALDVGRCMLVFGLPT